MFTWSIWTDASLLEAPSRFADDATFAMSLSLSPGSLGLNASPKQFPASDSSLLVFPMSGLLMSWLLFRRRSVSESGDEKFVGFGGRIFVEPLEALETRGGILTGLIFPGFP